MEIELTLKEAVFMKGTKKQQQQIEEKGRLSTDALNSLIRAFAEEFEYVRENGRGKNKVIILSGKRPQPIKLDKRHNNRATGRKTPFASQLELLIIKALRDAKNRNIEGSVGNVMFQMKMANERLCYYRQPNRIENYVKNLKENEINVSKDWLVHVLDKERDTMTGALLTALRRLEKKKLLKWSKYPVGAVKIFNPEIGEFTNKPTADSEDNPTGHVEYRFINLTIEQANKLAEIERNLKEKHEVTSFQIVTYPYSDKVQRYENELSSEYQKKGISYYFDSFSIRLVATENEVDRLLKDNEWMIEENYISKYLGYTIEKAKKRQQSYLDKTWGAPKEMQPVKQKLSEGVYVSEYESTVKHSVLPNF
ncbi:hypothetical protein ACMG4J_02500 [Rossellomorea marisflavi]|uniref:hypothetical protein n=1 Tax=Rossellomorea marisflavi TaxID=189381 RepID=UPI0039BF5556